MPTNRLRKHERADAPAGRAKRHPHAYLPGALLDEIGEHAEQPRQRQQKRQRSAPASARTESPEDTLPCARWSACGDRPCHRLPRADRRVHDARLGIAVHTHREPVLATSAALARDPAPAALTPPNRKPATSRAMPTTTSVREKRRFFRLPRAVVPFDSAQGRRSGSSRRSPGATGVTDVSHPCQQRRAALVAALVGGERPPSRSAPPRAAGAPPAGPRPFGDLLVSPRARCGQASSSCEFAGRRGVEPEQRARPQFQTGRENSSASGELHHAADGVRTSGPSRAASTASWRRPGGA